MSSRLPNDFLQDYCAVLVSGSVMTQPLEGVGTGFMGARADFNLVSESDHPSTVVSLVRRSPKGHQLS